MSNTLRSVGEIAAGIVGSAIGGPFGGSAAIFLFDLIVPPKQPKQPEQTFASSDRATVAGQAIWEIFGQYERTSGDLIRCALDANGNRSGIVEEQQSDGSSSGGISGTTPKPAATTTTVQYLNATFAFCEGPSFCDRIIATTSADGETVLYDRYNSIDPTVSDNLRALYLALYNSTSLAGAVVIQGDIETIQTSLGEQQGIVFTREYSPVTGKLVAEIAEHLRMYYGTEEQMPDSIEQAWYPDGVGADRGVCKIVFNHYGPLDSGTSFRALWSNYRISRRDIISARLTRAGIPASRINLRSIPADATDYGWYVDQREAARNLAEQVAAKSFHDLCFIPMPEGAAFTDVSRMNPTYITLTDDEIGAYSNADGSGQAIASSEINTQTNESKPKEFTTNFINKDTNFKNDSAVSTWLGATGEPTSVTYKGVGSLQEFQDFTDVAHAEVMAGAAQQSVVLMPSRNQAAPGCLLVIPEVTDNEPQGYRLQRIIGQKPTPSGLLTCDTVQYDPQVYGRAREVVTVVDPPPVVVMYNVPEIVWIDDVSLTDAMALQPTLLAVATVPDGGNFAGATITSTAFPTFEIAARGTVGVSNTSYAYDDAALYSFDYATTLRVTLDFGSLASISESDFIEKQANLLYWGGTYLTFITATPVSPLVYDITGLIPGLYGSDNVRTIANGSKIVKVLDENGVRTSSVVGVGLSVAKLNQTITYEAYSSADTRKTTGDVSLMINGITLKALAASPFVVRGGDGAGGYILKFFARTRYPESAYGYWMSGVPVQFSDPLTFSVKLYDGVTLKDTRVVTSTTAEFDVVYTMAELVTIFGSVPATLSGTIVEAGKYGDGFVRSFNGI